MEEGDEVELDFDEDDFEEADDLFDAEILDDDPMDDAEHDLSRLAPAIERACSRAAVYGCSFEGFTLVPAACGASDCSSPTHPVVLCGCGLTRGER